MNINADLIIEAIEQSSRTLYREGESDRSDRLAFEVGALRSKIRELCILLINANDEIHTLQIELVGANK